MLTNLLAIVVLTLVTNIVSTDNAQREWIALPCPDGQLGCAVAHGRYGNIISPATEKSETTTITEKRELKFSVEGREFVELLSTRELSSVTTRYRLKTDWQLSGVETNQPMTNVFLTNSFIATLTNATIFLK